MPLYEYECVECCDISDYMSTISKRQEPKICKSCGGVANFIVSNPTVALDGTDPGFPGAYDKWARLHENHGKHI